MSHELSTVPESAPAVPAASPIAILEAAIRGGVTAENIAVVRDLISMCREQRAEDAKAAFARAFFNLRKNMPEIYADKEARDENGRLMFMSIGEEQIAKKLEPHLMSHGFAMLFGQEQEEGRVTVKITLMHEQGHSETREFTVRPGKTNRVKDDTMADAGAATTAWRHLMIKMFGLKSRISDKADASLEGENISRDQVQVITEMLDEMVENKRGTKDDFLLFAGAPSVDKIKTARYDSVFAALQKKLSRK